MTPEQLNRIMTICSSVDYTREQAEEAIKAYAREMCDKQKMECVELMPDHLHGMEVYEVLNAPYPKELL